MANVKNNAAAQETRRRLLSAAGEVFAEVGYHAATIKQITDRAGASLAAVNYHFHDKAELYAEVIRRIETDAADILPPAEGSGDAAERFERCIGHVVTAMLSRGQPAWERVLLARELASPSPAMLSLLENVARPLNGRIASSAAALLNRRVSDPVVGHVVASVMGQCLYYLQHAAYIEQLIPQLGKRPDVQRIAEHVATFSRAGALRYARPAGAKGQRARRG